MFARFAELNTRKVMILIMLALIAGRLGWSVVSPYLYVAQSDTEQCKTLEQNVQGLLAKANHCDTNADCTTATFACPFSCNSYINTAKAIAPIKEGIKKYNEQCGFCVEECTQVKPVCVEHRCISFATLPKGEERVH